MRRQQGLSEVSIIGCPAFLGSRNSDEWRFNRSTRDYKKRRTFHVTWILTLVVTTLTACPSANQDQATPSDQILVTELDPGGAIEPKAASRMLGLPVKRAQHAVVAESLHTPAQDDLTNLDRLVVELAPDVTVETSDIRTRTVGSYLSIVGGGRLDDSELVIMAVSDKGLTGMILVGADAYVLLPEGPDMVISAQINTDALPREDDEVEPSSDTLSRLSGRGAILEQALATSNPAVVPNDAPTSGVAPPRLSAQTATIAQVLQGHTHDLLAVYSDDVASVSADPVGELVNATDLANVAYGNSNIDITLNLVAAEQVSYSETGDLGKDLDALEDTNDGILDEVHRLRDEAAADLVALIVQDAGGKCGKADLNIVSSDADDDSAFAVVGRSCLTNSSLAHELGHIAGAHHNTGNDPFPVPRYAHGWVRDDQFGPGVGWRSVMAYPCDGSCPRMPPAFSNPDITVGNGPAGNSSANNARRLNETAQALAGFRIPGPRMSLYEGANGTQDHVCVVALDRDTVVNFASGPNERHCDNDEARSAILFEATAGSIVTLLDDPDGSREDDWLEVVVKRDVAALEIPTLEASFENDDARVTYHRNNGLDGKASRLEVGSVLAGPSLDLYEGNDATQNLLCSVPVGQSEIVVFPDHPECDNDEARSFVLVNVPAGTVLQFFDDPGGSTEDDWVEIEITRDVALLTVGSFEKSGQQGDIVVTYHEHDGLDGKVSRLQIDSELGPTAELFEGRAGTQDSVCRVNVGQPRIYRFPDDPECDNDEARSLVVHRVPQGTVLLLFDSPDADLEDDWIAIRFKSDVVVATIDTFETSFSNMEMDAVYSPNNGLDGKVSRLEVTSGDRLQGVATFYEGNSASENKVCDLQLSQQEVRFKGHASCDNDEARSLVLSLAPAGVVIGVFDDPDCEAGDDVTMIETLREVFRVTVASFENSFQNADVRVSHDHDNGLDGKVSCVQMTVP
jgi:hypothetical protein